MLRPFNIFLCPLTATWCYPFSADYCSFIFDKIQASILHYFCKTYFDSQGSRQIKGPHNREGLRKFDTDLVLHLASQRQNQKKLIPYHAVTAGRWSLPLRFAGAGYVLLGLGFRICIYILRV